MIILQLGPGLLVMEHARPSRQDSFVLNITLIS